MICAQKPTTTAAIPAVLRADPGLESGGPALGGLACHPAVCPAAYSIGAGRRFARGFDRDPRALPQLVAAACQVGGLGGVARQLDGFVVRRARLLTAAQPAQQVGAG